MYAVIRTGGKQYKVSPGEVLRVERLDAAVGSDVEMPEVLMVVHDDQVRVGTPTVAGSVVRAQVVDHGLGKKVIVMKKKKRKAYRVKRGHRQPYSTLEIKEIRV